MSDETWKKLAVSWLEESRLPRPARDNPECRRLIGDKRARSKKEDYGDIVVRMNFSADSFLQWKFIKLAMLSAEERDLGHIAAGPVEHLLGWYGDEYIERVENCVKQNAKWRLMIRKAWRYRMSDEVWARVQLLQQLYD